MGPGGSTNNCPKCGAPLADSAGERCDYCGARLRWQTAESDRELANASASSRKGLRWTWIYTGVAIAVSLIAVRIGQFQTNRAVQLATQAGQSTGSDTSKRSGGSDKKLTSHDLSEVLTTITQAGGATKVLFSSSPTGSLALLDAATGTQLWKVTPASETLTGDAIAVAGDRIFVASPSTVVALQVRDGSTEWQASPVADYSHFGSPIKVLGDRLLLQLRDGTTQAFDVNTGKTLWTVKQTPPPHRLVAAGSARVDIRYNSDKRKKPLEVFVSDVATGQDRHILAPRCSTHSIIPANEPGPWAPALLGEDNDLYLFYGINRFCIDRWDLRTGKLVWQTNRDKGFVSSSPGQQRFLMDDERIVYAAADGIYQIRRRDGDLAKILDNEQNVLAPAYLKGNLLVLAATASWDGRECSSAKSCSLWGVDLTKHAVLWRHTLPKAASFPSSSERFAGTLTSDWLALVQVADRGQVLFDRLDPTTGVSKIHREIKPASTEPHYMRSPELTWMDGLVWVKDDGFLALDPASGAVPYRLR